MKFTCADNEIEGDFLFGAISNSLSVGGIVKYSESSVELNDGKFEVLLIRKPDNILKLQPIIDGILKRDFSREGIDFFRTNSVTIETQKNVSFTLDGEFAEIDNKLTINNLHNAITFIVPQ